MTTTSTRPAARGRHGRPARATTSEDAAHRPLVVRTGVHGGRAVRVAHLGPDPHALDQGLLLRRGRGYRYLTPFFSPCVINACDAEAAEFGRFMPDVLLLPYAFLSLPFLLLFRLTCYYYRQAYYRSLLALAAGLRRAGRRTRRTPARPGSRWSCRTCTGTPSTPPSIISLINTWDAGHVVPRHRGLRLRASAT